MSKRKLAVLAAATAAVLLSRLRNHQHEAWAAQDAKTVATGSAAGGAATAGESSELEKLRLARWAPSRWSRTRPAGWYTILTQRIPPAAHRQPAAPAGAAVQLLRRGRARRRLA
jgi:hypothetical protein